MRTSKTTFVEHAGIESYGAYIPITRLPFSVIAGRKAKSGDPEKAVAWADEDSITLAVTAGLNCLNGFDHSAIDTLIFASTTSAFSEKQAASVVAKALDLCADVKTLDISGSLRSGTLALQQAVDSVKAGSAAKVLVVIADCRLAAPKSGIEMNLGDGAAAFLVSAENVIAELGESVSQANEMMDVWRRQGDEFVHHWEDRFIHLHGYTENTLAAINKLFEKTDRDASAFQKLCLFGPDARNHTGITKAAGFSPEQIQAPLFGRVGNTGTAFVPMQLIAALEQAQVGDALLVASYGDGADAFEVNVKALLNTRLTARKGIEYYLKRRRTVSSYDKYLSAKGMTIAEYPAIDDQGISATVQYRNRDENLSLQGQVCSHCSTHQFPKGRVCVRCGSKDNWSPATYACQSGRVLTYTFDAFYPSPEPPTVATIVEVVMNDGTTGPRIHMQFTDAQAPDIKTNLAVDFVFRRIHSAGKRPNYFWKCLPAQSAAALTGAA